MANRHGLITGASGSGKTITLKVMAESFSEMIYINIEDADSMFTLVDRFEPSIVAYAGINFQTFVDLVEIPEIQGEL